MRETMATTTNDPKLLATLAQTVELSGSGFGHAHQAPQNASAEGLWTGLDREFETQIKAGLLPANTSFDMKKYVADSYLKRARATVKYDK